MDNGAELSEADWTDTVKYYIRKAMRIGKSIKLEDEIELGRNDICYCGSGLKYKKCCMK
jgi:uncharacterized protein YecA (UPF0149 family)